MIKQAIGMQGGDTNDALQEITEYVKDNPIKAAIAGTNSTLELLKRKYLASEMSQTIITEGKQDTQENYERGDSSQEGEDKDSEERDAEQNSWEQEQAEEEAIDDMYESPTETQSFLMGSEQPLPPLVHSLGGSQSFPSTQNSSSLRPMSSKWSTALQTGDLGVVYESEQEGGEEDRQKEKKVYSHLINTNEEVDM